MQKSASPRPVRKRRGQPCTCFNCGKEVYPLPLDISSNPMLPIKRGYAFVGVLITRQTRRVRLLPCLFCSTCANPREVAVYEAHFEPMIAAPQHDASVHADEMARAAEVVLLFYVQLARCCTSAPSAL